MSADREAAIREEFGIDYEAGSALSRVVAELAAAREREKHSYWRERRQREALNLALMHLEDPRAVAAVRAALAASEGQP